MFIIWRDLCPDFSGFALFFDYYRKRSTLDNTEQSEKVERFLAANKKIIGSAALIAAALHFLFPRVILL